jgi:hypothetical protein
VGGSSASSRTRDRSSGRAGATVAPGVVVPALGVGGHGALSRQAPTMRPLHWSTASSADDGGPQDADHDGAGEHERWASGSPRHGRARGYKRLAQNHGVSPAATRATWTIRGRAPVARPSTGPSQLHRLPFKRPPEPHAIEAAPPWRPDRHTRCLDRECRGWRCTAEAMRHGSS